MCNKDMYIYVEGRNIVECNKDMYIYVEGRNGGEETLGEEAMFNLLD